MPADLVSFIDVLFCLQLFQPCVKKDFLIIGSALARQFVLFESIREISLCGIDSRSSVVHQPIVGIFLLLGVDVRLALAFAILSRSLLIIEDLIGVPQIARSAQLGLFATKRLVSRVEQPL